MIMPINQEFKSKNFRPRKGEEVQFLVLHYTALPLSSTLGIFTNNSELAKKDLAYYAKGEANPDNMCNGEVSAHYVNSEDGEVYQLVDEGVAAFHAGVSYWSGVKNINNSSIGIEHENIGYDWLSKFPQDRAVKVPGSDHTWCQFTKPQIEQTIILCREIIARHNIKPYNVVGHSDVACGRKSDPGPMFPWKELAEAGIGMWYDIREARVSEGVLDQGVSWVQARLAEYGYDCQVTGVADDKFKNVMQAFQMHFRPTNIDGDVDLECTRILYSLCKRKAEYDLRASVAEELAAQGALVDTLELPERKKGPGLRHG
jgi:N-acetyl-anhydromuramyl-L-alanine amidase AmpD